MGRPSPSPERRSILALLVCSAAYVAATLAASSEPGPRAWGLHLLGFLPSATRALPSALLLGGVVWIAFSPRPASRRNGPPGPPFPKLNPGRARAGGADRRWLAILPFYAALLYALRARTYFLGDGIVWLNALQGEARQAFNEPLSAAAWHGFAGLARALAGTPDESTFALLPILCGVLAAAMGWGIVGEAFAAGRGRWIAWALFLLMGVGQLYFGYIESYPIVSVAVLLYVWLALRHVRGAGPPWLLSVSLAMAIGAHLMSLFLLPSYVVAVARRPGTWRSRAVWLALPAVLAPGLLLLAGTRPSSWLEPFRVVSQGSLAGSLAPHLTRPYPPISWDHAIDVANAILLAIPIPALLLLAWALSRGGRVLPVGPRAQVIAAAAGAGLLLAAVISLPVAPAQDWDIAAVLLLPMGIAGIVAGKAFYESAAVRAGPGLIALSAGSLLAFVSVNADRAAGIERFQVLIGPAARVSPYGRGYGASMLSEYFEDRREFPAALRYAEAALEAERTNPRYWVRVGTILYNLGRYEEAIGNLEEAIRRGGTRSETRYNLGLCYVRTGRFEQAVAQFRSAVERDGDRPDYRHNLGMALIYAGKADSARVVWAEVLRRWPDYALTARSMERRFEGGPPPR